MITLILATLSLFPVSVPGVPGGVQARDGSLLQTLIPEPTGQNGLEDYLRAIDMLNDGISSVYAGGSDGGDPYAPDDIKAAKAKLAEDLKPLDYLAVCREFADKYADAYDLIVQGNLKPCVTPPPTDSNVRGFPAAVQVAELVQARAYCLSADGKQSDSLDTLLNGLTFSLRSGSTNMMAYLADTLAERKLFDEFLDQLPRMSLGDAQRLANYVTEALKQPPLAAELVARSEKVHELMFAKNSAGQVLRSDTSDGYAEYGKALANATPEQLQAFSNEVEDSTRDAYQVQERVLLQPESQWYDGSATWKAQFGESNPNPSDTLSQLAVSFGHMIVAPYRNLALTELRRRAQLRLLGLHARVLEYRWRHHHLPASLKEVADPQTLFDPLSGEPFVYETGAGGTYRLYSKGRPETGPVELHYAGKGSGETELRP